MLSPSIGTNGLNVSGLSSNRLSGIYGIILLKYFNNIMGNNSSKSSMELDTKLLNKTTTDFLSSNQSIQNTSGIVVQDINMSNSNFMSCKPSVSQNAELNLKTIQQFDEDNTVDFKGMLSNAIDEQIKKKADQSSGFLSTAIGNETEDQMKVKKEIENIINTNIKMETLNEQITQLNAQQKNNSMNVTFDPCGYQSYLNNNIAVPAPVIEACKDCTEETNADGSTKKSCEIPSCTIDQNVILTIFSEQIVSSIAKAISDNSVLNEMKAKYEMTSDQSAKGVSELTDSIFSGFAGVLKAGMIPIIIIGIVAVVAGYMLLSKKTKSVNINKNK
jgi:hypothetical protein